MAGSLGSVLLAGSAAIGGPINWAPGTNDFNMAGNWSPASVPGISELAVFGAASQTSVNVSGNATVDGFVIDSGAPAYTFNVTAPVADTTLLLSTKVANNSSNAPTFNITGSANSTARLRLDILGSGPALGNGNVIVNSGGVLDVRFSQNLSTGVITVNQGGVLAFTSNAGGAEGAVVLAGGTLSTGNSGVAFMLGSIDGAGTVNLNNNAFTVGSLGTDMRLAANVTGVSLTKVGTGTLTLTGANSYANGLGVASGTVVLGSGASLSAGGLLLGGSFISQTSATLGTIGFFGGNVAVSAGNTLRFTGTAYLDSGLNVFGSPVNTGTIELAGSSGGQSSARIVVAGGTLRVTSALYANSGGSLLINPGATLEVGPGGVLFNSITNDGALVFNRSDSVTVSSSIAGTGSLTQIGNGTLVLSGDNIFTGVTTIGSGATLQLGNGAGADGSVAGNIVNNGILIFNHGQPPLQGGKTFIFPGIISGTGSVVQRGAQTILTGENSYSGGTTIDAGSVLQAANSKALGTGAVVNNGRLLIQPPVPPPVFGPITIANAISGSGAVDSYAFGGTNILTGSNTHTGGTNVFNGILQIGNGGTSGSIVGDAQILDTLQWNRSDGVTFAGVISGPGTLVQAGSGTLTLTGVSTLAGPTRIAAGRLHVTGSIASSSVAIGGDAMLSGTGRTGSVSVASGGTFNPGAASGTGTLTVQGNLNMAPGSTMAVYLTPAGNSSAAIAGTASINGVLVANAASGSYVLGQRYTLLNAAGGVSGTFEYLSTPGLPGHLKGRVGYDAKNIYLYLDANALTPLLPGTVSGNAQGLAAGIDASIKGGASLSASFQALFNFSGPALTGALDQLSGPVAAAPAAAANQTVTPFLTLLTQAGGTGPAANFAPMASYDAPDAPHPAQRAQEIRLWSSVFGGRASLSGNAPGGAQDVESGIGGFAVGAERSFGDGLLLGASIALGRSTFASGTSAGKGSSDDVMLAFYGRKILFARGYLAAALSFGWHDVETRRLVTVAGADTLGASFNTNDIGGRIESGYDIAMDADILTPYAAFFGQTFHAPAYAEAAISGTPAFALAYAANYTTAGRSELGAHYRRDFASDDAMVALDMTTAWAHELSDDPLAQASFLALPGSNFTVRGIKPAVDTALLGLGLHMEPDSGMAFGLSGNVRVGGGTTILTGSVDLSLHW